VWGWGVVVLELGFGLCFWGLFFLNVWFFVVCVGMNGINLFVFKLRIKG
jgi:hypothetical protein